MPVTPLSLTDDIDDVDVVVNDEDAPAVVESFAEMTPEGTLEVEMADGSVVIDLEPRLKRTTGASHFDDNIAEKLSLADLSAIAGTLVEAIKADDDSRAQWLSTRAKGIDLLGLKLDDPRSDIASGAPLEGMSTVRDPLLLEACIRFMSNASAELLPASGPVKVRNDGPGDTAHDIQAETLEKEINRYLTTTASDYYPDTKRMLFMTGFGGSGFKKVYHSPLKNRPVSEAIDAKDLIVSDSAVDLTSASRVTHIVRMKPSDMIRMRILGVYRDVDFSPAPQNLDPVTQKMNDVVGIAPSTGRVEDEDYELWECYCELDIPGYEHTDKKKPTGLPLPYRVTIDVSAQEILEIRRDWDEGDESYARRDTFVEYPYIKAFGFWGIGLLHIMGNLVTALTAATREVIDAGMLANFPGFLYLQNGNTKQLTNHFRVPPGGGAPLQSNGNMAIRDMVMPLPYKEPGPAFMQFMAAMREVGQRVGSIAEVSVGEGKQNAPVGTTLALIEQATKVEGAVHKGLHVAQSQELRILKKLFREDPESLWRHSKHKTAPKWNEAAVRAALDNVELVPQADPNTPSHMQRMMKALAIKQLQAGNPALYDSKKVDERVLAMIGIDNADDLFAPPQPPMQMPQDPRLLAAQINAQSRLQQTAMELGAKAQESDKDRQTKLMIEGNKQQVDMLKIQRDGQAQPEIMPPEQRQMDPKVMQEIIRAQAKAAEMRHDAAEKQKDRDSKLMIEKIKLAANLAVHPDSMDEVQHILDTPKVPLYGRGDF